MSKWVLVPEGITEAVDAAKDFYELYKRTVVSGCTPMEQLRFVAALKFFESMLNAAPSPDKQPVAWYVFDKRTQKHWYTNKSVNTAGYYAKEYSYREADGSPSMLVVPLYENPQKPLTDDQIDALVLPESGTGTVRDLVRIVEAAHGIGRGK
jgi:hypothetical protein